MHITRIGSTIALLATLLVPAVSPAASLRPAQARKDIVKRLGGTGWRIQLTKTKVGGYAFSAVLTGITTVAPPAVIEAVGLGSRKTLSHRRVLLETLVRP